MTRHLSFALVLCVGMVMAPACSLQNHEGPDVTCADLLYGCINACRDGIIAQCADGETMRYHVCKANAADICEEDWQIDGAFKCLQFQTECEGCRPQKSTCDGSLPSEVGTGGAGGD